MENKIAQKPKEKQELLLDEILYNEDLANRAPDSTRDNGPRPPEWRPPLMTKDDYKRENPYSQ